MSSLLGTVEAHRVSCLVLYDFTTARKNTTNIFQLCTFEFLVSFFLSSQFVLNVTTNLSYFSFHRNLLL